MADIAEMRGRIRDINAEILRLALKGDNIHFFSKNPNSSETKSLINNVVLDIKTLEDLKKSYIRQIEKMKKNTTFEHKNIMSLSNDDNEDYEDEDLYQEYKKQRDIQKKLAENLKEEEKEDKLKRDKTLEKMKRRFDTPKDTTEKLNFDEDIGDSLKSAVGEGKKKKKTKKQSKKQIKENKEAHKQYMENCVCNENQQ